METSTDWHLRGSTALTVAFTGVAVGLVSWVTYRVVAVVVSDVDVVVQAVTSMLLVVTVAVAVSDGLSASKALSVMNARPAPPEHPARRTLSRLADEADLPTPECYLSPFETPTALSVGWRRTSAAVCVTTGLLELLDDDQLEAVLAREVAHVSHRDWLLMTLAWLPFLPLTVTVVVGIVVVSVWFVTSSVLPQPLSTPALVAVGVGLPVAAVGNVALDHLARHRQLAADRTAATVTGNPEALASALERLESAVETIDRPLLADGEYSYLFVVPTTGDDDLGSRPWQPTLEERVGRLRELGEGDATGREE